MLRSTAAHSSLRAGAAHRPLQGRMTDSNRNLAAKVLQLLGDIARAMGPVSCFLAGQTWHAMCVHPVCIRTPWCMGRWMHAASLGLAAHLLKRSCSVSAFPAAALRQGCTPLAVPGRGQPVGQQETGTPEPRVECAYTQSGWQVPDDFVPVGQLAQPKWVCHRLVPLCQPILPLAIPRCATASCTCWMHGSTFPPLPPCSRLWLRRLPTPSALLMARWRACSGEQAGWRRRDAVGGAA